MATWLAKNTTTIHCFVFMYFASAHGGISDEGSHLFTSFHCNRGIVIPSWFATSNYFLDGRSGDFKPTSGYVIEHGVVAKLWNAVLRLYFSTHVGTFPEGGDRTAPTPVCMADMLYDGTYHRCLWHGTYPVHVFTQHLSLVLPSSCCCWEY